VAEPRPTTGVTAVQGLRLEPLRHYLAEHLDVFDPDATVDATLLAGGRSNLSYRLTQRDRSWVLRRPPLGHVMPTAHDMAREHRVLSGLSSVGFAVPRPLSLCTDTEVIGAPFMLMEFVPGTVVATAVDAAALSAEQASRICATMVETLGSLHAVDAAAADLQELGRPEGYLSRQVARWLQQWERTKTRELSGVSALGSWLEDKVAALPRDMPWSIVHGDYRLDNLILALDHDVEHAEIRAVLDWEMSTLGDPVADLAVSLVYWSRPGEPLRHRLPVATGVTDGPGFWDRERLVSEYAISTGRDLGHLDVCLALACLKLAVIMESIHYRSLQGQQLGAATETGIDMGAATEALVDLGLAVRAGAGVDALAR
jgi:aminoglycoside phosphotransferase (APT) family kinase protein